MAEFFERVIFRESIRKGCFTSCGDLCQKETVGSRRSSEKTQINACVSAGATSSAVIGILDHLTHGGDHGDGGQWEGSYIEKGSSGIVLNEEEMKFTFERERIKAVTKARHRPNWRMGNMNSGFVEELLAKSWSWPFPWLTAS